MESAREVYETLAPSLASWGVLPIQERAFGPKASRLEVMEARKQAIEAVGLHGGNPCTWVSRKPEESGEPICVQLWGVTPVSRSDITVETVHLPGNIEGRLLTGRDLRLLWLSAITGTGVDGSLVPEPEKQATRMFTNAKAALEACDFEYLDVARTWISLRRLLDWYDGLNRVRTAFHHEVGITGGPDGSPFPASTGIQGAVENEECVMDLIALHGAEGTVGVDPLVRSSRQDEPFAYGSGFSRGIALELGGVETLHISGTASVGSDGATKHVGDRDAQVVETLLGIAALLEPRGARLRDICAGTLFYKDLETLDTYRRVSELLEIVELPLVPVMADVCRPDLLVEIEAIAGVGVATEPKD